MTQQQQKQQQQQYCKWDSIEDTSAIADPVWFSRPVVVVESSPAGTGTTNTTTTTTGSSTTLDQQSQLQWKPLRVTDCKVLNELYTKRQQQCLYNSHVNAVDDIVDSSTTSTSSIPGKLKFTIQTNKNESMYYDSKLWTTYIDSGRCKADIVMKRIYYNYIRGYEREMISSTWFYKHPIKDIMSTNTNTTNESSNNTTMDFDIVNDNDNGASTSSSNTSTTTSTKISSFRNTVLPPELDDTQKTTKNNSHHESDEYVLEPIPYDSDDTEKIEILYQKVLYATVSSSSSVVVGGNHMEDILKEEVILSNTKYKVIVHKSLVDSTLSLRRVPNTTSSSTSWIIFGSTFNNNYVTIQRGYGTYKVIGEEEECYLLGNVQHLIYVIHGIGEAFFTRNSTSGMNMSTIIDNITVARCLIHKRQIELYNKQIKTINETNNKRKKQQSQLQLELLPLPNKPNRIELIPIEWYSKIHDSSSTLMKSLQRVTLSSIPALRSIANDVVFDILMYMTPTFCTSVLECVTQQINDTYKIFCKVNPHFIQSTSTSTSTSPNASINTTKGGKVSLMGHSLGSVIVWDLLTILKENNNCTKKASTPNVVVNPDEVVPVAKNGNKTQNTTSTSTNITNDNNNVGYQAYVSNDNANTAIHGTYGPTMIKQLTITIPFEPYCTILLGSPLGMFLTLRGAHAVFDELRIKHVTYEKLKQQQTETDTSNNTTAINESAVVVATTTKSSASSSSSTSTQKPTATTENDLIASPFTIPSQRVINIFHPSDPVAYRIEPLLLSPDIDQWKIPSPIYLTSPGQDVRFHLKMKQIGEDVRKNLLSKQQQDGTKTPSWGALFETAAVAIGNELLFSSSSTKQSDRSGTSGTTTTGDNSNNNTDNKKIKFPLGGTSNRVDYTLQTGVIDNEYISAVTAHGCYFSNPDIHDFLISLLNDEDKS